MKVPACPLHNTEKSGDDQAILKAMLIPIIDAHGSDWLARWYSTYPDCAEWVMLKRDVLRHQTVKTVPVAIYAEHGMEDIPNIAHSYAHYEQWIRALTTGIIYEVSGQQRLHLVDWDTADVVCWDVIKGQRSSTVSTVDITTHAQLMNQEYANTHAEHWLYGRLPNRRQYPPDHYYYRMGFTGHQITIEHVFYNLYRFWCTFVLNNDDFELFFAGYFKAIQK